MGTIGHRAGPVALGLDRGALRPLRRCHPDDVDTAYFGGVQLVRTTDGGRKFSRMTPSHPDIQRLAFDAGGGLIVAEDSGVHVISDNGDSWSMVGGLQDNGPVLRVDDQVWEMVMGADGGCNASHPATPNVVFSEIYNAGNIYRSDDGGINFSNAGTGIAPGDRTSFLPPFAYHLGDPDVLFHGTHRMWKTNNRGGDWEAISAEVAGNGTAIRSIALGNDALYQYVTTTGDEVHVSSDGGVTFRKSLEGIHGPRTPSKQIRVAPWAPKTAFLGVCLSWWIRSK
ncbi:MAG: hypothetical protein V3V08_18575 [Nannocystaceae bacterium]